MVLSDISIKRPVFATVISVLAVVLGIASFQKLPVREYPAIDPPIVSVVTAYKGASNEVVQNQITEVIEAAISGIDSIKTVTSVSREERSQVNIEFLLGRDIDDASSDVRDRIARIADRLPEGADTPRIAKVDSDARPILWFALTSDRLDSLELTDYVQRFMVDRMSIVPGVASVVVGGERRYAMRVWLDRRALAARGITVEDLEAAVRRNNVELPSGRVESTAQEFSVKMDSRLKSPEAFAAIVVATRGGYQVKLGEVARIEIGAEDERSEMRANGRTSVGLGILRQSTANTLDVADGAKAEMERLKKSIPPGIQMAIGYDESVFIHRSIDEVLHALAIGVALVIGVIFVFLRSVRAVLIPAVAIPVSLIASFPVLAALGFSVNVLTLLALVLAIGIVVDDAIVVLENIHRRIEEGEAPLLASIRGARQIAFAVISTTLVLAAVFVPISFMEGNTGRLFTEFGIALATAVLFSGIVALTLSPMMCSKLLRHGADRAWLHRATEPAFTALNGAYRWLLTRALTVPLLVLCLAVIVSGMAAILFTSLHKEFAPVEDRGYFVVRMSAPEGANIAYTREQVEHVERLVRPLVQRGEASVVMGILAPPWQRPAPVNSGLVFVKLSPWEERDRSQQEIVRDLTPRILAIPGVRAFAINPASLGQRGFRPPIQVVLAGADYGVLREWRDLLTDRMNQDPGFLNVDSDFKETKPELLVDVDRLKAADLGVSLDQIGRTLEVMFGSREVGTFTVNGEEYKVIAQAEAGGRRTKNDLTNFFVRSATSGRLVPLSNLVTMTESAGPADLGRVDRLRAITITASLAGGYGLGDALASVERMAEEVLPREARIGWQGESLEFKESQGALYVTFALAFLIVFLVLAAQFESFIHPLIIMLSVPLAITGGLAALLFAGISLNIYSQIGMILLVGLMAKNGILIVEFANQLRDDGRTIAEAVLEAATVRLRPILMTSIATVFGAMPLAIASGAGAEGRRSIGIVIIGGVILSTVLTLFVIPALYTLFARFTKPINEVARRLSQLETQPAAAE